MENHVTLTATSWTSPTEIARQQKRLSVKAIASRREFAYGAMKKAVIQDQQCRPSFWKVLIIAQIAVVSIVHKHAGTRITLENAQNKSSWQMDRTNFI